jgi:hypothetical protein
MQSSFYRRTLPQLIFIAAALAVGIFLSHKDSLSTSAVHIPNVYEVEAEVSYCNQFTGPVDPTDPICDDGTGAAADLPLDAALDLTNRLFIGVHEYNFSQVITTTPGAGFLAPGAGGPGHVPGTHPNLGDLAGQLVSATSLGLTNNPSNSNLTVPFKFLYCSVDNSTANDIHALSQAAAGSQGTLENMQSDQGAAATAGVPIDPTIPANGIPAACDRYPSYLNAIFDCDFISYGPDGIPYNADDVLTDGIGGDILPVQPLQRLRGGTLVAGSAVELNLLIFDSGDLKASCPSPHPFSDLVTEIGYTTVTVLQNPTAAAAPSAITDFSTDLLTLTTVWGETKTNPCRNNVAAPCNTVGGISDPVVGATTGLDRARTPAAAGTYLFSTLAHSLRDTDEDGFENALDTCATTATPMTTVQGTIAAGSTTTVIQTDETYTAGALVGNDFHVLESGTAANDADRGITANTANSITVAPALPAAPADNDLYSVGFNPRRANPNNDPDADAIPGKDDPAISNAGDPDGQLLAGTGCDPSPLGDTNAGNHDGDIAPNGAAWQNAGDNCPLVGNGTQLESELEHSYYEPAATNPAEQGGPKTDANGDACDADDSQADGPYQTATAGGSTVGAKCFGGIDLDDDGYCTAAGPLGANANDANDANASATPESYQLVYAMGVAHSSAGDNPPERQPVQVCNDGIDNDLDGVIDNLDHGGAPNTAAQNASSCRPSGLPTVPAFPTCPLTGCPEDSDGDGTSDEAERHIGTNALGRCAPGGVSADPPSTAWPLDFIHGGIPNSTDRINITDLTSFLAGPSGRRLDTRPGDAAFSVRWDMVPGTGGVGVNWIQIGDLTALFAGTPGFPSMNSGAKVFGTAFVCSAHPTFGR